MVIKWSWNAKNTQNFEVGTKEPKPGTIAPMGGAIAPSQASRQKGGAIAPVEVL